MSSSLEYLAEFEKILIRKRVFLRFDCVGERVDADPEYSFRAAAS